MPCLDFFNLKLPGARSKFKFEVITAHITVCIKLRLNSLQETITIGRRKPGSEPLGLPIEAHHISPLFTANLALEQN